jgi:hypothetical protein
MFKWTYEAAGERFSYVRNGYAPVSKDERVLDSVGRHRCVCSMTFSVWLKRQPTLLGGLCAAASSFRGENSLRMRGPRDAQLATVLPCFKLTDSVIYPATRAGTVPTNGVVAFGITGMAGPPRSHEPGTAAGFA